MKRKKTSIIFILTLTLLALGTQPIAIAETELYSTPSGAKHWVPTDPQLDETSMLLNLNIESSGQIIYTNPGQTLTGDCTYQRYSGSGNPNEIQQAFFVMSWTPNWPAPEGYYIPIYNGIPGVYPGITRTTQFSFNIPTDSGTYYLYWCRQSHYSMRQAVDTYDQPLTLPAHVKIVVGENLVRNPSFEQELQYWSISSGTANYVADSTNPQYGFYSAKGMESNEGSLGRLYQDMTDIVQPNHQYRLGGWIKTENVVGWAVIALDYVASNGWTPADGYVKEVGYVTGTQDWTYFESEVFTLPPMPDDASNVWFLFDFNAGSGTAWWDNVFLYEITSEPSTTISIQPTEYHANKAGQTFNLSVNVLEVTDLYGFDICIKFNTTYIDAQYVIEGSFLSNHGNTLILTDEIDNTNGKVAFAITLLGPITGADGEGTLFTIGFKAMLNESLQFIENCQCLIEFESTELANSIAQPIAHSKTDGIIWISMLKGDFDGNGCVDIYDIVIIATAYNTVEGDPEYRLYCDFDQDGDIDIFDVIQAARNYGICL